MSTRTPNRELVTLAREARGFTGRDLAERLSFSQSKLSKLESGLAILHEDDLQEIAQAVGYPVEFFYRSSPNVSYGTEGFHHRKRQSLLKRDQTRIHAEVTRRIFDIQALWSNVDLEPMRVLPSVDLCDFGGDVEEIARQVRSTWGLPEGPIRNLTAVIESFGGIVFPIMFGTQKVDAISKFGGPHLPMFFPNTECPADRSRRNLAHELGHLILHSGPAPDVEPEADRFADEFLMPKDAILEDFNGQLNFQKLIILKHKWGASMASLIHRALSLKVISQEQRRDFMIRISKNGWRKREPEPLAHEQPTLIAQVISVYREQLGWTVEEIAEHLALHPIEFIRIYKPPMESLANPIMRVQG